MNSKHFDLMLCGGGVIGLSIAYECARHGWKVLVVDAGEIGHGASWAGAGILPAGATKPVLDPLEQLRALSHRLHEEWAHRLLQETGIDNEFRICGGLYLASSLAERATLKANQLWWDEHGIEFETWSYNELKTRLPGLSPPIQAQQDLQAWFVPQDARLRNPRHIQALSIACSLLGVELMECTQIDSFETQDNRIVGAQSSTQTFIADRYCITSGAWASQLLQRLDITTGVYPVRGQMVLYKFESPHFLTVVNDGHRYLVPRDDGYVLAGSSEEEVGFNAVTTDSMIAELREWAESLCPELSKATIERTWAGLRPGSFDSYPYLGTLYPYQNGFVAAGHFRHGLHWSTATALLMWQWMNGHSTDIDLRPFRVQRGTTLGANLHITSF